ncbi:Uu.00g111190.m01.CDS01 [Anthostomella pinea]|uniref:Uu.00g111190.m01.CDS01 n=1 Tax=Anthostomella pinea TaxID=933095 RepID=A0AAI8VFJ9_9PEZI|nr:Uu.00g111190.m01.CDS01 [Anthostomella pinea]
MQMPCSMTKGVKFDPVITSSSSTTIPLAREHANLDPDLIVDDLHRNSTRRFVSTVQPEKLPQTYKHIRRLLPAPHHDISSADPS